MVLDLAAGFLEAGGKGLDAGVDFVDLAFALGFPGLLADFLGEVAPHHFRDPAQVDDNQPVEKNLHGQVENAESQGEQAHEADGRALDLPERPGHGHGHGVHAHEFAVVSPEAALVAVAGEEFPGGGGRVAVAVQARGVQAHRPRRHVHFLAVALGDLFDA